MTISTYGQRMLLTQIKQDYLWWIMDSLRAILICSSSYFKLIDQRITVAKINISIEQRYLRTSSTGVFSR